MIVYHFINELYGLKGLRERRLKVSDMTGVNDPFDFLSVAAPTQAGRKLLRKWLHEMSNEFGLLCFSRNWHSPVQWAHYADRHKGLCLGFDIPTENLCQVNYVQSRPPWPTHQTSPEKWSPAEKRRVINQLLYTKYVHWSYEDEYRLFTSKISQDADGFHYMNFCDGLKLVRVMVGAHSELTRNELSSKLGDLAGHVETFKVRPAFKIFRIVRQRSEAQWR